MTVSIHLYSVLQGRRCAVMTEDSKLLQPLFSIDKQVLFLEGEIDITSKESWCKPHICYLSPLLVKPCNAHGEGN